jgi:hypothetical protein
MSKELLDNVPSSKPKEDLDNANYVLFMGIVSIILNLIISGLISFTGLIIAILAVVKGRQVISLYREYPNQFTTSSFNKARVGFICGIVGIVIWSLIHLLLFVLLTRV